MRKLIVTEFLTLDGVYQGPGSPDEDRSGGFEHGGWQRPYFDDDQMRAASEGIAQNGAYLFGRRTYEIFADHWPKQPDSDPFAKTLNGLPKYVVSRTLRDPLVWRGSTLIHDDAVNAIRRLKEGDGKSITVLGSGELVQTLLRNDLVDELGLLIHPLTLGSGKRFFRDGGIPATFELADSKTTSKGVLILTYRPAA